MTIKLMRWTFFFAALMLALKPSHSFTVAQVGRVNGQAIHTTYFQTPNNQGFDVKGTMFVGQYVNGNCSYNAQYDIGETFLKTGNFTDLDAFQLVSIIGDGNTCMSIYYSLNQPVIDTFQLVWDGFNYVNTIPASSEVTVL